MLPLPPHLGGISPPKEPPKCRSPACRTRWHPIRDPPGSNRNLWLPVAGQLRLRSSSASPEVPEVTAGFIETAADGAYDPGGAGFLADGPTCPPGTHLTRD